MQKTIKNEPKVTIVIPSYNRKKDMKSSVKVSVIVVNHNGRGYLRRCLLSVLANDFKDYEIIVVDNGSSDGSISLIKDKLGAKFHNLFVLELKQNYGPAFARNEGAEIAKGEYLAFLDNDTQVKKDWITEAIKLFQRDQKIGCIQCKLLLLAEKNKYDYAGEYLNQYGFLVQRAQYKETDNGQFDQEEEILAAKSAGMFIRKDIFNIIGGFDKDYFIYMEETDLGWRSWLAGYKTVFCPRSIVYHEFGTSIKILSKEKSNFNIRFHGTKNYIMTLIKNLGNKQLALILPKHITVWFCFAFFLVIRGNFRSAFNILRGIGWNIIKLPKTLSKRKSIQSTRVISDKQFFSVIFKKRNLLDKIKQFFMVEKEVKTTENI